MYCDIWEGPWYLGTWSFRAQKGRKKTKKEWIFEIRESDVNEEGWAENSVRCAVLSLLKHHSQSVLAKLCPLSQSTISTIANGRYKNRLSLEKCREFGQWYAAYLQESDYPVMACHMPPDSRMTFHPDHELPLLRNWYREFPNPSSDKFIIFAHELNKGHVRQDRPKVTPQKIKIWWKNERQREKRQLSGVSATETRTTSTSTHPLQGGGEEGGRCSGGRKSGVKTRKRPRSSSQGSKPRTEGCEGRAEVEVEVEEEEEEEVVGAVMDSDGAEVVDPRPGTSSHAWVLKADQGSQSSGSGPGEEASFLASLSPPVPDRRLPLKPSRKSLPTTEAFVALSQGQGHMLTSGPPSSTWQSSFLAWSSQRRSPEVTMASPDTGLLLPWQHHRLPVLQQRVGSRSESEREGASSTPGVGFGSMERYRYTQSHDLPFAPSSSSTSMDFSNIL